MVKQFDLIIVGGGLVGAGFAVALQASGLQIALVDARMPSNDDPRLFALNASSCQFLQNLGFWPALQTYATPIHEVHVSHQGNFGTVRMHHQEVGLPNLGHVVPARYIEEALNHAMQCMPNLTLYRPARLQALQQNNQMATVTVSTAEGEITLQAPLVIGADGTASTVRELVNIGVSKVNYNQSALVARIQLERSHQHIAYERFYEHGALAMLPLTHNESATIISADTAEVERLCALNESDYLAYVQKIIGRRLGRLQSVSQRHRYPLQMQRAERMVDQCVLLLGNAAHTLHPIAAQGFNLAMYEVAVLVEGIQNQYQQGKTVTAADLEKLLATTRMQQTVSVNVSHWLNKLFSFNSMLANLLLSAGMTGFNVATPVKSTFIKMMTGRSGRVPTLLLRQYEQ